MADEPITSPTDGTASVTADPASGLPSAAPAADWRALLPEDLRADAALAQIKGKDWSEAGPMLAKGYVNAQKLVGQRKPEDAVPESPDKYPLKLPEFGQESGVTWDQARMSKYIAKLHAAGYTPKQMQAAVDTYAALVLEQRDLERGALGKMEAEDIAAGKAKLAQAWGPEGSPGWKAREARVHAVVRALEEDGATDDEIAAMQAMAVKYPVLLQGLARWGDQMLERGYLDGHDVPQGMTADEANTKADEVRAKIKALPEGDPARAALVDQLWELNRIAAGPKGREAVATLGR